MKGNYKTLLGLLGISWCILLVMGGGVAVYNMMYADALKVKEKDQFCPQDTWSQQLEGITIPGHTIILVDTSNKISKKDGKRAFNKIEEWLRNSAFLQKISVYGLPKEEYEKHKLLGLPWCVPKQGENADPLFYNVRKAEVKFQRKFLEQIKKIFGNMIKQEKAPQSPIIETLEYFSDLDDEVKIDSVWLISDMLQHSPRASDYKGTNDIGKLCNKLTKKLAFSDVKIYYIDRGIKQQSSAHNEKWEKCFSNTATIEWY